jgi:hypothetical protein
VKADTLNLLVRLGQKRREQPVLQSACRATKGRPVTRNVSIPYLRRIIRLWPSLGSPILAGRNSRAIATLSVRAVQLKLAARHCG